MGEIKTLLYIVTGFISGGISYIFGSWTYSLFVLIAFIVIDFLLGWIVAGVFKNSPNTASGGLCSSACLKGSVKKVMSLVLVAIANMLGQLFSSNGIPLGDSLREITIWCLILTEGLSIFENLGLMGIDLPEPLTKALDVLQNKLTEKGDNQ